MEKINIHTDIEKKLKYFIEIKKIPNIIFHGVSGCGKNTLVKNFIHDIYQDDKETIKNYVMAQAKKTSVLKSNQH